MKRKTKNKEDKYVLYLSGERKDREKTNDCWLKSDRHKPTRVTSYGRGHGRASRKTTKG
jgi:hypothetical protein